MVRHLHRELGPAETCVTTLMPDSVPPLPAAPRERWIAVLVLGVAVIAAYANTWNAPFVYDDVLAIPENPTIRRLWPLTDVLLPQSDGGLTVSGRPMLNLSFALNYAVSGTEVWSYHALNALVHLGAALLVFGLVRRTLARRGNIATQTAATTPDNSGGRPGAWRVRDAATLVALVIAGGWALHPLQTQAVTYIVQRAESLMGFFYLLTLYAFVRAVEAGPRAGTHGTLPVAAGLRDEQAAPRARGWAGVSIAACVLGMATKEVMATAPLLVLLYDRTFVAGTFAAAWRRRHGYYLALGSTWLVLAALLLSTGGNRGGTVGLGVGLPLWAYPLTQFQAVARYLGLSAWPQPLVFEYGTFWAKVAADVVPYAVMVLPLLAATVVGLRRWPVAGFVGGAFFLILAPSSLAPGTIQMIVEHRMYLPLAAVVAAVGVAAWRMAGPTAVVALGAAAVALALLTARRNHDYRSHLALWTDTVAKRPLNPRAHVGLAEALAEAGRFAEAIAVREEAVRLRPEESTDHYNLALTLAEAGQVEAAVRQYLLALKLQPNEARTHNNLAILLARLGRHEEALTHYAAAVQLKPNDALYHYNHGIALMRAGQWAAATASYEAALRLRPDYADAHFNLGTALVRMNKLDTALAQYAAALSAKPGDPDYGVAYGGALLLARRPQEALAQFQRVLTQHPASTEAAFGAANALSALRRFEEAAALYETVLRRAPEHAAAHFKLGNALLDLDRVTAALPHYEAAVRLNPTDAEAQHNLGIAFARLERWDDARRAFDTALQLKPDYADARRSREQLRRVTGR